MGPITAMGRAVDGGRTHESASMPLARRWTSTDRGVMTNRSNCAVRLPRPVHSCRLQRTWYSRQCGADACDSESIDAILGLDTLDPCALQDGAKIRAHYAALIDVNPELASILSATGMAVVSGIPLIGVIRSLIAHHSPPVGDC